MADDPKDASPAPRAPAWWGRLRSHKVVQWTLAYAATAYTLLHAIEMLSGALEWPHAVVRFATLLLLLGAPIAATLAWFHGHRARRRVGGLELAVLAVLLVAAGGVLSLFGHRTDRVHGQAEVSDGGSESGARSAADARPSIAVLPFKNRSAQRDDAFFVDGMHDDVLTQLSKVSALKVISRTSVERFRDSRLSTRAIAAQLGVDSILEGGVQRAGDRVRINVQLIDADSDTHLWAESYDRELTAVNIFAIQSEVAAAIADALHAQLTVGEKARVAAVPTRNLEAWEAYQLGRQRMGRRTSAALGEAEQFFRIATRLDPTFALAHVGLADALSLQVDYAGLPRDRTFELADAALAKALEIDPDLAEAVTSAAWLAFRREDYAAAAAGFRKAIRLNPNYATAYHWSSRLAGVRGEFGESLSYAEQAARLDPLAPVIRVNLGNALERVGRFDEAQAQYQRSIVIDPSIPNPYFMLGGLQANAFGRLDRAMAWFEKAEQLDPGNPDCALALASLSLDLGDAPAARRWLTESARHASDYAPAIGLEAVWLLYQEDRPAALAAARRALALESRDALALALLGSDAQGPGGLADVVDRYAMAYPELAGSDPPSINHANFGAAIDLAVLLQRIGQPDRAARLLDGSEAFIRSIPRLGWLGSGIADARIHALRGRREAAVGALQQAVHAGWRGPLWRYARDFDPALAALRSDPAFLAVFQAVERDMVRQLALLRGRPTGALPESSTP